MTQGGTNLQYVTIDNFSPGIYDDWFSGGGAQSAPDGAAQLTGTYGCVSATGGGLIPAPRRVNRIQETLIQAGGGSNYPTGDEMVHITAFRSLSPVLDRTNATGTRRGVQQLFPDQLFFVFEWYYTDGMGGFLHTVLSRTYKMYQAAAANPAIGTVVNFDVIPMTADGDTATTPYQYGYAGVDISRTTLTPGTATDTGPAIAVVSYTSMQDLTNVWVVAYPDVAAPDADGVMDVSSSVGSPNYSIMAHQDRILGFGLTINNAFGDDGELPDDLITGSVPNDITQVGFPLEAFVNENPGLFGSWVSMNASEALFVKQQRGGYTLRGDVAAPTVVRLPSMAPTGEGINIGVSAKNGAYVYGAQDGVYGWTGGDVSQNLSPQLDGWFWQPGSGTAGVGSYIFTRGSFASVGRYVFAPNGFMLDTASGGWWRLTSPTDPVYAWHDVSANGNLIAVPASFTTGRTILADWYDIQQGQSYFTWTSQPLRVSQGRLIEFRDLIVMAQGSGTLTLALSGLSDSVAPPVVIPITSTDRPVLVDTPIAWKGSDVVLAIQSQGTGTGPAPRVYRVNLGYHEAETARLPG